MTSRDDRLVEVKFQYGWIPGIESSCKAKHEDCEFQQFFNEDRSLEVSTFLYWHEIVSLHKQLQVILDGVPINTSEWPEDNNQQSLEEFEEEQ
jgi:hypothetical protein